MEEGDKAEPERTQLCPSSKSAWLLLACCLCEESNRQQGHPPLTCSQPPKCKRRRDPQGSYILQARKSHPRHGVGSMEWYYRSVSSVPNSCPRHPSCLWVTAFVNSSPRHVPREF